MGDHADDYNQMCEDEPYWHGVDDEVEYLPPSIFKPKKTTSCRCCGKSGLSWKQAGGKWTLFQGQKMHQCPVNPLNRKQPA